MCLINEKKSNIKEIIGYAVVIKINFPQTTSVYGPSEYYDIGKRYVAYRENDHYRLKYEYSIPIPGFHGFYRLKDVKKYKKFIENKRSVVVKCRFEDIIAHGKTALEFNYNEGSVIYSKAFRAMYRTIIEEVQEE